MRHVGTIDVVDIGKLYRGIASELGQDEDGNTWSMSDFKGDYARSPANLVGTNGQAMHLSFDQSKGRITISGHWPMSKSGKYCATTRLVGEHNPSITVSAARGAAVIAGEIQRRFLPAFTQRWSEVAQLVADTDAWEADRSNATAKLIAMIDGASESQNGDRIWTPSPYGGLEPSGTDIHFGGHMYLPFEVAAEVIAVIEKWRATKGGDE